MPKLKPPQWNQWAWRWADLIESLGPAYAGRLQRARSYARNGHVWRLSVHPGKLSAQVLGSYGYYSTSVRVPPLPTDKWDLVVTRLMDAPQLIASLLAGDPAPELDEVAEAAGVSLFPTEVDHFAWSCTCPDWEKPCKHALAVCYDFAAHLDRDPSLLLTLRGQALDDIASMIQTRWAGEPVGAETAMEATSAPSTPQTPQDVAAAFYQAGAALDEMSFSIRPPDEEAALLYSLGKPPFASEHEDPLAPLARIYTAMTEQALRQLNRGKPAGAPPGEQ
jgi:uncharacterized Zn finger protein